MTDKDKVADQHSNRLGIGMPIRSEADAREAVKMSGLPIFVLGLLFALLPLFILIMSLHSGIDFSNHITRLNLVLMTTGLVLIFVSLKMRGGAVKPAPIAAIAYMAGWAIAIYTWRVVPSILALLLIGLSIDGLRGWWWLRRNERKI